MGINERFEQIIDTLYNGNKSAFATAIGVRPSVVDNIVGKRKGKPSFDVVQKVSAIEEININWFVTGNGDMIQNKSKETATVSKTVGVPYYDVDFIAGFNNIFNDQTTHPAHNIVFKPYSDATLWCNVTGRSMEPKINNGDIIALKECTLDDIQYGEIYAVVMDTIRTVKILRKSEDPDKLKFVPININSFDEQEFEKKRIIKIYEVLGCISRFF